MLSVCSGIIVPITSQVCKCSYSCKVPLTPVTVFVKWSHYCLRTLIIPSSVSLNPSYLVSCVTCEHEPCSPLNRVSPSATSFIFNRNTTTTMPLNPSCGTNQTGSATRPSLRGPWQGLGLPHGASLAPPPPSCSYTVICPSLVRYTLNFNQRHARCRSCSRGGQLTLTSPRTSLNPPI